MTNIALTGLPGYPGQPGVVNTLTGGEYVHGIQLQSGTWVDVAAPLGKITSLSFRVIATITALRALDKTLFAQAVTLGYYAAGDAGGGTFWYDASDTTSTDNGGSVIVATDGGRWKLFEPTQISIRQFGAKGDGTTDDAPAIQAALNVGVKVYAPSGTYMVGTTISIPTNTELSGEFTATVFKAKVSLAAVFSPSGVAVQLRDFLIDGNNYFAAAGVKNQYNYLTMTNLYVQNCGNGFYAVDPGSVVQSPLVSACYFVNNTVGIFFEGNTVNHIVCNSYIVGGDGIVLDLLNAHTEGARIYGNVILPTALNSRLGTGIMLNAGLETQIFNNIIDQCIQYPILVQGLSSSKSVNYTKITDNWLGFSASPSGTGIGLFVQGNVANLTARGNTCSSSPTYGINFNTAAGFSPANITLSENLFLVNTTGDVQINATAGNYRVSNNVFTHGTTPYIENNNGIAGLISGNTFPVKPPNLSTATKSFHNYGIVTDSVGVGTIPNGSTTVTVNHGLAYTPNFADITLTPVGISTNDPGEIALTAVSSTQFVITCRNNPGASTLSIAWKADVNR